MTLRSFPKELEKNSIVAALTTHQGLKAARIEGAKTPTSKNVQKS